MTARTFFGIHSDLSIDGAVYGPIIRLAAATPTGIRNALQTGRTIIAVRADHRPEIGCGVWLYFKRFSTFRAWLGDVSAAVPGLDTSGYGVLIDWTIRIGGRISFDVDTVGTIRVTRAGDLAGRGGVEFPVVGHIDVWSGWFLWTACPMLKLFIGPCPSITVWTPLDVGPGFRARRFSSVAGPVTPETTAGVAVSVDRGLGMFWCWHFWS